MPSGSRALSWCRAVGASAGLAIAAVHYPALTSHRLDAPRRKGPSAVLLVSLIICTRWSVTTLPARSTLQRSLGTNRRPSAYFQ